MLAVCLLLAAAALPSCFKPHREEEEREREDGERRYHGGARFLPDREAEGGQLPGRGWEKRPAK